MRERVRACSWREGGAFESLWEVEFRVSFSLPALFARYGSNSFCERILRIQRFQWSVREQEHMLGNHNVDVEIIIYIVEYILQRRNHKTIRCWKRYFKLRYPTRGIIVPYDTKTVEIYARQFKWNVLTRRFQF